MALERDSHEDDTEDLELHELEAGGSHDANKRLLPPSKDGHQSLSVPIPRPRWLDNEAPKPVRKYVWAFGILTGLALLYEYYLVFFSARFGLPAGTRVGTYGTRYGNEAQWPGWAGVEHMFIFGDSYTVTGFDIDGAQPSRENPMGNPEYASPANFSLLGAATNWVPFLTGLHNASIVQTVNLAYGGATVDMELIHPFDEIPPGMRPLKFQVQEEFIPLYASEAPRVDWKDNSTLFAIWIGLNDIHNATPETSMRFGLVFEEFAQFVDELFQAGARNFLFLNIPPIEKSPLAIKIDQIEPWRTWVAAWNQNVTNLASNLTSTYDEASTFIFDAYELFDSVIEDPCSHPETCEFKDVSTFCDMYAFGTDHWNSSNEKCPYRIDEYLWMNDLHPSTRINNLTAMMIAEALT